jgi:hypothetical protein
LDLFGASLFGAPQTRSKNIVHSHILVLSLFFSATHNKEKSEGDRGAMNANNNNNNNNVADERRLKLISVLEGKEEFSFRTRHKIDELVEEFLDKTEDDVHDMLCENNDAESEDYHGLDSNRDTEAEVETTIRFFPNVLTRRKTFVWDDDDDNEEDGEYPIQCQCLAYSGWRCNEKAVYFVPIVARLAIELGLFEEEDRGGLLCQDFEGDNVLQNLMYSDTKLLYNWEHHEHVDDIYLQVLVQLRRMGLLKKEDIQRYDLLNQLCWQDSYSPEKRFRFLVEWDPSALLHPDKHGFVPLHCAAGTYSSIQEFLLVFEYGIRYYPKMKGTNLLFRKNNKGETPFQLACKIFKKRDKVMKVVEDTLIRSSSSDSTPRLIISEAIITAANDENIHLDCVYFLIQRQPDILQRLLSSTTPVAAGSNNNNDEDDYDEGNDRKSKKQKREYSTLNSYCTIQ